MVDSLNFFVVLVKEIAIIGAHIRPSDVKKELDDMVNVYNEVKKKWNNPNIIMMGDFNAGSR